MCFILLLIFMNNIFFPPHSHRMYRHWRVSSNNLQYIKSICAAISLFKKQKKSNNQSKHFKYSCYKNLIFSYGHTYGNISHLQKKSKIITLQQLSYSLSSFIEHFVWPLIAMVFLKGINIVIKWPRGKSPLEKNVQAPPVKQRTINWKDLTLNCWNNVLHLPVRCTVFIF